MRHHRSRPPSKDLHRPVGARGFSLIDVALLLAVGATATLCFSKWYDGRECVNLSSEAERLLPKIQSLVQKAEQADPGQRLEMTDCAFTNRGVTGDCDVVGVTSNFATTYAYVVIPQTAGSKIFALGQTPTTYGSVLAFDEAGEFDRSASGCR